MAVLNELEPKEVFRFFEEISAIPRGSRDTKRISDYLVAFAKERDLKVIQDEVNNVIIFQPGTPGYEESEPVILQGHMDMVCEKTSDSTHDFKNDGLELYVEDGFLKAKDTTLGGDDGVAVAMALALMDSEDIPHPPIEAVFTVDEALEVANKLGYPVLVRPSYVLGGAGMEIALNDGDIKKFMKIINRQFQEHPILIDKYLSGKEVEVDAVCDENGVLIPGVMEHVERAGVHSGDSISVYPPQKIKPEIKKVICDYTQRLAKALHVIGLINIQFIVYEDEVYVIEVNPRSSRTIPYISKVTDIPVVDVATKVIMGHSIKDQGYEYGLQPEKETVAVKMPVFSFEKIKGAEISLGPEMKSTGEVLGIAKTFDEAIYKAFIGTGINLPKRKNIICTIKDSSKEEFLPIAKQFYMFGYDLYSTEGTYNFLKEHDVPVHRVNRIAEKSNTIFDLMLTDTVDLVIDIGFLIRRFAVEAGIPIYTSLDTAHALINCLEKRHQGPTSLVDITKLK